MQEERTLQMRHGVAQADNIDLTPQRAPADTLVPIARTAPDQSNTSVVFGRRLIMKVFRRVEEGPNPDVEMVESLTGRRFPHVPPLVGTISYTRADLAGPKGPALPTADVGRVLFDPPVGRILSDAPGPPPAIAMLQEFVPNQGNPGQNTNDRP